MIRVVFDSNCVLSALLYRRGTLAWLRSHWQEACLPLLSHVTASELVSILGYPKFAPSPELQNALLADYLPFCEKVEQVPPNELLCRDPKDQPFLDLAFAANASVLVTSDQDLLVLAGQTPFAIETPAQCATRMADS